MFLTKKVLLNDQITETHVIWNILDITPICNLVRLIRYEGETRSILFREEARSLFIKGLEVN